MKINRLNRKSLSEAVIPRRTVEEGIWVNSFRRLNSAYSLIHRHLEYEICYFPYDEGRFFINDKEYVINPREIFIVNSGEYHQPICNRSENKGAIAVYFSSEFISLQPFRFSWLNIFLHSSNYAMNKVGEDEVISNLILELREVFESDRKNWVSLCWGILSHILVLIEDRMLCNLPKEINVSDVHSQDKLNRAIEYIKRNIHKDIKLEYLYDISTLSKSQFSVKFKSTFRYTATEYISRERCSRAVALLKGSQKSISEIAYLCGFNNLGYFNRRFKLYYGVSPSAFRSKF